MLKRRESAEKAETSHQKKSLRKTLDEERERLFDLVKSLQEQCRSGKIFESEFLSQEAQLREVLEQERRRVYDVLIQMEGLHRSKDGKCQTQQLLVLLCEDSRILKSDIIIYSHFSMKVERIGRGGVSLLGEVQEDMQSERRRFAKATDRTFCMDH